jgi:uncharacterized cupredoxin-like copper-binding protein
MRLGRWLTTVAGAAALLGTVALSGPAAWAQDATPEAVETTPARPAHIHTGNCNNIGEVIAPLTDLTGATGDDMGQARRAARGESSFTAAVPMTLDAILAENHAINVHLSADEIDTYIACGELGGALTPNGALVVGLGELNNSGYTGIAYLAPGADGASTAVSVFIAPTSGRGQGRGGAAAEETPAADAAAGTPATLPEASPAAESAIEGTPAADTGETAMVAGEQVPVSLVEFAISMPETLPAGQVTFAVTNDGSVTHSFEIENESMEAELETELAPGETGLLTVDLAPGTYEVYCPVGNHAEQGMELEVTVA